MFEDTKDVTRSHKSMKNRQ